MPGQLFSGVLGLLRPSSAVTKEKQEAERIQREGPNSESKPRVTERPKIVWFKPTDKRVPLIAIPTEQAPKDFLERNEDYANTLFCACIKRWPITSLHPFGTLVEEIGSIGQVEVETSALLKDCKYVHVSIGVSFFLQAGGMLIDAVSFALPASRPRTSPTPSTSACLLCLGYVSSTFPKLSSLVAQSLTIRFTPDHP
jgi:hypothetical protein